LPEEGRNYLAVKSIRVALELEKPQRKSKEVKKWQSPFVEVEYVSKNISKIDQAKFYFEQEEEGTKRLQTRADLICGLKGYPGAKTFELEYFMDRLMVYEYSQLRREFFETEQSPYKGYPSVIFRNLDCQPKTPEKGTTSEKEDLLCRGLCVIL